MKNGRVIDEDRIPNSIAVGSASDSSSDTTIPRMSLKTRRIANYRAQRLNQLRRQIRQTASSPSTQSHTNQPATRHRPDLVWASKPLTRRDLDIPVGPNTHRTGQMLFKKGALEDIDQHHYFRQEVFAQLDWTHDDTSGREHLERAEASFQIVVGGVNQGSHRLKITHNPRTDTKTYKQGNSMTALHWGKARPLIAQEGLLGRTIQLYRDDEDPKGNSFVLEVD